jgi:hypothetical protein
MASEPLLLLNPATILDATNATAKLSGININCDKRERMLTPPCQEQAPRFPIDDENQPSKQAIGQSTERVSQLAKNAIKPTADGFGLRIML